MRSRLLALAILILVMGFAVQAKAVPFTLDHSFGSDPVSGDIVVNISAAGDGTSATVQMDLTALTAPEYVKELYLNITNVGAITGVDFLASSAGLLSMTWGTACCKAGGDGFHDILLGFATANNGNRWSAGGVYSAVILGVGLTETMFDDLGTMSAMGQFHAVAKVNSTGSGGQGSDWVGDNNGVVPEPTTLALLGLGLVGLGWSRRNR